MAETLRPAEGSAVRDERSTTIEAKPKGRVAEFDATLVRDLSEKVYRDLLERGSPPPGAVDRMLEKDGDGGVKLRERAGSYDRLTRAYLRAFNTQ